MDLSDPHVMPPGASGSELQRECEKHGTFTSRHIIARIWSRCPTCNELQRSEEQAIAEAAREKEIAARHERMIRAAAIPQRFVGRSFENFEADTDPKRHALTIARDYAEGFRANARRGAGLIFAGRPGTGKSHLAAAILQSVISPEVRYITCLDMIRAVRETWRKDSETSEGRLLDYLQGLELLVVDEVGMQYGTEGEQTIVFDVLDRRYREVRPTIILTNQDKAGLRTYVGDRTFDRLVETSRWVAFDWESFRPQLRKRGSE